MNTRTYDDVMRDFTAWSDAMHRVFGRQDYDYTANGGSSENGAPAQIKSRLPLDVWATDEAFFVTAYLPGVDPESVTITYEGDQLTIGGQIAIQVEQGLNFIRRELYHGGFRATAHLQRSRGRRSHRSDLPARPAHPFHSEGRGRQTQADQGPGQIT